MKLEDQVCNLELSKKLKSLAAGQDSVWYWATGKSDNKTVLIQGEPEESTMLNLDEPVDGQHYIQEIKEYYSAFTCAELGGLLPLGFRYWKHKKGGWYCDRKKDGGLEFDCKIHADTESNARAAMLIYLIENKLTPNTDGLVEKGE